jgi:hypothetical protein
MLLVVLQVNLLAHDDQSKVRQILAMRFTWMSFYFDHIGLLIAKGEEDLIDIYGERGEFIDESVVAYNAANVQSSVGVSILSG